ncbi:hexokinase type 2-like [Sabethes cyaneus]|uniref:hexokinase type 2-like n=1 Tax=Sabethes cyaneus TaxID=53552 RepID=UPI00237D76C7|nr:hexokinase type 2-like [Sabethes cyaneus]
MVLIEPYYGPTPRVSEKIREKCQKLILTDEQVEKLIKLLIKEINLGLGKATHPAADVKCFATHVQDLPNGQERGKFLALDLGGTNLRVLLIHREDANDFETHSKTYAISDDIMCGSGEQLFDYIADCLVNFTNEQSVFNERLPLGFTFSFPLIQLGLNKGILAGWTKGFTCSEVVNQDIVQLLRDALDRRTDGNKIEICAILNDTVGTLMSCAWKNRNCRIGLVVGTGCNACYVEKVENCELFDGSNDPSKQYVLINTEWGALGDNGALEFVRTEYDQMIDLCSTNPKKQTFEKMTSGLYMGELVRLVIVKCTMAGLLFHGVQCSKLFKPGRFFTKYVSEIESDPPGTYKSCHDVLGELGLKDVTDEDCANLRYICECVSSRAAHLVAAGIAALINKMDEKNVTVGVDGSVYRYHPRFHDLMTEKIGKFVKPDISFDVMLSEDGSGRGAALVAAAARRETRQEILNS